MTDERKRSSVGFWATAFLLLPVLYVASFGPACWIASRVDDGSFVAAAYQPLMRLWWGETFEPSDDLLARYGLSFSISNPAWGFVLSRHYDPTGKIVASRYVFWNTAVFTLKPSDYPANRKIRPGAHVTAWNAE